VIDGQQQPGWTELGLVAIVGILATAVRLADDTPRTVGRLAWLCLVGLGLASGGWLFAKAIGLDGWPSLALAWIAGAAGQEAFLPVVRRWMDRLSDRQRAP
jgi:hypothetical protein